MQKWGTKAETLAYLYKQQSELSATVLPLVYFSVADWRCDASLIWRKVSSELDISSGLIVRSSAQNEDKNESSHAGEYESISCMGNESDFRMAVEKVIASYGTENPVDQVLVQPLLTTIDGAGVAFTAEPNGGGQYYVISYDLDKSTSSITAGQSRHNKLFYAFKQNLPTQGILMPRLCKILSKLEKKWDKTPLDVEFAFVNENIYLLQVRPLCLKIHVADIDQQFECLQRIRQYVQTANQPKPFLYGKQTLYSNMTDWNPAEMIGTHPKPLALSLYKELITDSIWAYQRDNYGYMRLRSFPLMVDFEGLPYIDVRVSFNSFIPADLSPAVAEKLVNYYLKELIANPSQHDKVEFDILFSCYTFDLPKRIVKLRKHGFTSEECEEIVACLRRLTNRIINSKSGLWRIDAEKIRILEQRYNRIVGNNLTDIEKMYWLMEDCKRYGTLPFAGLARAGFIAVQLLQSLLKENIIAQHDYDSFMNHVDTVGSKLKRDFANLKRDDFLKYYGHLRPGTYDITSPRYDERPDLYFNSDNHATNEHPIADFCLSLEQLSKIKSSLDLHGLDDDVLGLFTFIRSAIEGREYAKFVFTKNVSEILRLFGKWGHKYGFTVEDCAYGEIGLIKQVYEGTLDAKKLLQSSIKHGRKKYAQSSTLVLPPLIDSAQKVTQFYMPDGQPTFVTQKCVRGKLIQLDKSNTQDLSGKILLIMAADPGYDWIFSRKIAGFITAYGGANSHMAIRAGELGLPAVIGAGEKKFAELRRAQMVEIDAALAKVTVLR